MLETPIESGNDMSEKRGGVLHVYPYVVALAGVIVFLLAGIFVVNQRLATNPPPPRTGAWSGNIQTFLGPDYTATTPESAQRSGDLMRQVQDNAPYTYKIPVLTPQPPPPSRANPASVVLQNDSFDYDAFIAQLSQDGQTTGDTSIKDPDVQSAYSFIPSGLISTSTRTKNYSAGQENLYNYGNDVGSTLQTFEINHKNQSQVLKNQIQDPRDPLKVAAVVKIGTDLENIGIALENMDYVPPQMRAPHAALAKIYKEMGRTLILVPNATTPKDFLSAIYTYNAAADIFAQNFVAMATLFTANGITFAPDDPGSVFTFTNTSGL